MDEARLAIAARFAEERRRCGHTQGVLATSCGVDRKTVGNVERGAHAPSAELLMHVAEQGMDVQYVLTGIHSRNVEDVWRESGHYSMSADDRAKHTLSLVVEAVHEMGLELDNQQLQTLVGYAYDHYVNKEMLKEFVQTAYAVAGRSLPDNQRE